MRSNTIGAIVVGYQPDLAVLDALLISLLKQVDHVILVDNGGSENYLSNAPKLQDQIIYQPLSANQGLGSALNTGFAQARSQGCSYVATFDQDSEPPDNMLAELYGAHQDLAVQGVSCAAVGPCFYDGRSERKQTYPLYREHNGRIDAINVDCVATSVQEVDTLITSGMLVSMTAWCGGLSYDAAYFVDYTDTDWCFRARAAGWQLYAHCDVRMGHALADQPPVRVMGLNLLRYSPLRRYYYFRNTVYFLKQPYVSTAWKRRLFLGAIVRLVFNPWIDQRSWASLRMMLHGLWDGLRDRGFR